MDAHRARAAGCGPRRLRACPTRPSRRSARLFASGGGSAASGFGGPPAHISLLRRLVVDERGWLPGRGIRGRRRGVQLAARACVDAARNPLRAPHPRCAPGPWPAGWPSSLPGLVLILALSALFLESSPPAWIRGAGAGAGAAVAAVAVHAAWDLLRPSLGARTRVQGACAGRSTPLAGRNGRRRGSRGWSWCSWRAARVELLVHGPLAAGRSGVSLVRCRCHSSSRRARARSPVARLDRVQGRRALLRRRVRDRPADAGRRGRQAPLAHARASS